MDINQLKALFIEEATEIIEKMDVDILNLEENPDDKLLLDELFRGVHTLKGSANAFGFAKLGDFVHHFEDTLGYCRKTYTDNSNSGERLSSENIDVFLDAVDLIKTVMQLEIEGREQLPQNYDDCLEQLKAITQPSIPDDIQANEHKQEEQKERHIEFHLGSEFNNGVDSDSVGSGYVNSDKVDENLEKYISLLQANESLYCIKLSLDNNIYIRGLDHSLFFKMLSEQGKLIESSWDMSNVPSLDEMEIQTSYVGTISIFYVSKLSIDEINDFFEYLDDDEYQVSHLFTQPSVQLSTKKSPTHPELDQDVQEKLTPVMAEKASPQQSKVNILSPKNLVNPSYIKVDTLKLDELFDSIGELVIAQSFLSEAEDIKNIKNEKVERSLGVLSKITRRIQKRVMSLRMVPIHDTFEKMKRVARDASKKVGKEIKLSIKGAETEIDKTMIDALSEPLIHIIRNAIDHGIENDRGERLKEDKNTQGQVTLNAYHRAGSVVIEISDDGGGIDKDKVLEKAIEKALVSKDDELSDTQIYSLIMQAGFSTADQVSDISGRGVGLDVVRNAIEKLNGKVEIHSNLGLGTTFTIILPLTLAIIDGMLVKSEEDIFIIPTLSIIESFIPPKSIVHRFKKEGEFVDLRGEMLPIVRLNQQLDIAQTKPDIWESTLICIESENGKFALLVDDIIGRQQVVIKSLGPVLARVKELAGSAIMGSGEVALILNTEALFLPITEAKLVSTV